MKNTNDKLKQFLRQIPKCDLHVHLDGSLRMQTLIDLAKKYKVKLPSNTVEGLNKEVFKDNYKDLVDYLQGFGYSIAVMQDPESLERISYEFALDNIEEGVRYVEVRFAPQFHINKNQSIVDVFTAINKGLDKAKKEFNNRPEVKNKQEPAFEYGIIACAMRSFGKGFSEYFDRFIDAHEYSSPDNLCRMASYELVLAMTKIRDEHGVPIVGFDIAGAEAGNPPSHHRKAYDLAHKNFFNKTVHAGEAYGAESIFQAITMLHADRIGHGYYLFDETMISDPSITDKQNYIEKLAQYIANRRVTIEVCLTSNLQTIPSIREVKNHNFKKMLEHKLSTTICTDNRTVSKTTVSKELELAVNNFIKSPRDLKNLMIYGFKRSFFPGSSYTEKRQYVREIIDYYEKVEANFDVKSLLK
jgi:adenosine deaminase